MNFRWTHQWIQASSESSQNSSSSDNFRICSKSSYCSFNNNFRGAAYMYLKITLVMKAPLHEYIMKMDARGNAFLPPGLLKNVSLFASEYYFPF